MFKTDTGTILWQDTLKEREIQPYSEDSEEEPASSWSMEWNSIMNHMNSR